MECLSLCTPFWQCNCQMTEEKVQKFKWLLVLPSAKDVAAFQRSLGYLLITDCVDGHEWLALAQGCSSTESSGALWETGQHFAQPGAGISLETVVSGDIGDPVRHPCCTCRGDRLNQHTVAAKWPNLFPQSLRHWAVLRAPRGSLMLWWLSFPSLWQRDISISFSSQC